MEAEKRPRVATIVTNSLAFACGVPLFCEHELNQMVAGRKQELTADDADGEIRSENDSYPSQPRNPRFNFLEV
jgi:hypothetical protein